VTWSGNSITNVRTVAHDQFFRVTHFGPALTPDQIAANRREEIKANRLYENQARKEAIKHRLERAKVRRTAAAMLKTILSSEQWRDWQRYRAIRFRGRAGVFEINPASGGELYLLDHEAKVAKEKFCVHAPSSYPTEDRVASLLLALMADEDVVLQRANRCTFRNEKDYDEKRKLVARRIRAQSGEFALN